MRHKINNPKYVHIPSLMGTLESDSVPTNGQAAKESPPKNRHKIPNVHSHNS